MQVLLIDLSAASLERNAVDRCLHVAFNVEGLGFERRRVAERSGIGSVIAGVFDLRRIFDVAEQHRVVEVLMTDRDEREVIVDRGHIANAEIDESVARLLGEIFRSAVLARRADSIIDVVVR